eukprot:TRINITY_DN60681_c0_g1_i1.p1 TRINITY_DN60681_c0_g1~~TRINITY_DN60681_c0_g1_i1.p1  ORF type:complete len:456 (+),score=54.56 TRINITY_DN60681_c0_g1_i1:94-1461(+)
MASSTTQRVQRTASPGPIAPKEAAAKKDTGKKDTQKSYEIGPLVVWAAQLNQVVASYYLFNALIVSGRKDVESIMRNTLLQSQTLSIVAEILWSALHPKNVSASSGIACALLFTVVQGTNLIIAFTAAQEAYYFEIAMALQCAAGLAMVPVAQIGHNYTLEKRVSPARYRSMAIWCASSLALAVLLTPTMASPFVAVLAGVLPTLVITILLGVHGLGEKEEEKATSDKPPSQVASDNKATIYVGPLPASAFLFLGCAVGTIGEALTDMAVTLALRKHLREGRGDLAIANQTAVIVSMLLAYWTETRPGGGGANKAASFILVWSGCQVFRSCSMEYLQTGGIHVVAFFVLVFIGRYIGPLGKAAQDSALLKLLSSYTMKTGDKTLPWYSVPGTLLWTMRMAVARLERPLCQLILLHAAGLSVPRVSGLFTGVACLGVLAVLKLPEATQEATAKKEQ